MTKDDTAIHPISLIFGLVVASTSTYGFYLHTMPSTSWETLIFLISGCVAAILAFAAGYIFMFMVIIYIKYGRRFK